MLYVTHDQAEAMTLGDRVVVMRDGRVQQVDAPLAVYRVPRNTFVAGFIGSPPMNLLEGAIVADGGLRFVAKGGALAVPLPAAWRAALDGPRPVILGVRPEDVSLAALGMTGVPARVDLVEPLGQELLIYASAGGQELTARVAPGVRAEVGAELLLGFDPDGLHFFDPDTRERIAVARHQAAARIVPRRQANSGFKTHVPSSDGAGNRHLRPLPPWRLGTTLAASAYPLNAQQ